MSTYHRERDYGLDIPLHDCELSHHLLGVRRRILALIVDVPVDPSGHGLASEVFHLEIQLHDFSVTHNLPGGQNRFGGKQRVRI